MLTNMISGRFGKLPPTATLSPCHVVLFLLAHNALMDLDRRQSSLRFTTVGFITAHVLSQQCVENNFIVSDDSYVIMCDNIVNTRNTFLPAPVAARSKA